MDNAVRKMFTVPPAAILKERQRMADERAKKKAVKKPQMRGQPVTPLQE